MDYEYIEINPYNVDETRPGGYTKKQLPLAKKRELYPRFAQGSPRGLVPALNHRGERVWESTQTLEYIEETFPGTRLLPDHPHARAQVRIWMSHCDVHIQKPFYTLLMEQDPSRRGAAANLLLDGARALGRAMAPASQGPFFLGSSISMLDIALAPFWERYSIVGGAYRNLNLRKDGDADLERLEVWWQAVQARPSVAAT